MPSLGTHTAMVHRISRSLYAVIAASLAVLAGLSLIAPARGEENSAIALSLQRGIEAYRAGAPLHALQTFTQVAEARPLSALPAIWAGIAAIAAGRMDEADHHLRAALRRPHSAFQARFHH